MKILWINMTVPPEADARIGGIRELKNTGGWVLGLAHYLTLRPDIHLAIASASTLVKDYTIVRGEKIIYFVVPASSGSKKENQIQCNNWKHVYEEFQPDVVHIHGTEYKHALTWLEANGNKNTVVSIQGILSACWPRYYSGISQWEIIRNITFRDLLKGTIFQDAAAFKKTSMSELKILKNVEHVIGRTKWDKLQAWAINPKAKYHFCNEILRHEFYENDITWKFDECRSHSIFVSQASVPYKGLHQLLKALPIVLSHYPDTKVRVAGFNIIDSSWKRKIMRTGYGRYLLHLIKRYSLQNVVSFTGRLNAREMINEYLNCNVFVLPSSIENSPNALGEAQILGVPCVASNVGGVDDLVPNNHCGYMFRFHDPIELAYYICLSFKESETFDNSIELQHACQRHDPQTNVDNLLQIYKSITE